MITALDGLIMTESDCMLHVLLKAVVLSVSGPDHFYSSVRSPELLWTAITARRRTDE